MEHPIAEYRKARHLSQAAVAEEFIRLGIRGVSQQTISQMEQWRTVPRLRTLLALAELLGVSTDRFMPRTPRRRARNVA